ncbi:hypothetical protein SASPL_157143 [Salvia splendens]|uniref:Uncharacterized protein n=1 Tax=Salvia splendens TaxID=180675 RepID=A0A8X8VVE0_SALSN|nr:hypothetical protein SASPL_157143 [Salvia splendens]
MHRSYDYHSSSYSMDEYLQRMPSMIGDCPNFPNVQEVAEAGKHGAEEKSIDVEADGFIKKKHKGFALCKWDTFKLKTKVELTQCHDRLTDICV